MDDTRLYYRDTGPAEAGESVVVRHGGLWNTRLFDPQIEALRQRYR